LQAVGGTRRFARYLRHVILNLLPLVLIHYILLLNVLLNELRIIKGLLYFWCVRLVRVAYKHYLWSQAVHLRNLFLNCIHTKLIRVIVIQYHCPRGHQSLMGLKSFFVGSSSALVETLLDFGLVYVITLVLIVN
jgi:hypothetical protein